MPPPASKYRFGPFEVRVRTRELYKYGTRIKLRPQPFQILQVLAERAGDVVTRDQLRAMLWSSETFVDFEHGLNTAIKELRGALSDSATEPRYIETVPRLGYRLIVPLEAEAAIAVGGERPVAVASAAPAPALVKEEPEPAAPESLSPFSDEKRPAPIRWQIPLAAAALLACLLAGYGLWRRAKVPPQASAGRLMLAVLPFDNLTGDAGQEYFSDGLTEEMIAQLGRLDPERLGVIARTSVVHYKNSHAPLAQIGRELGVQYVLEGSVRRDAGKIRVSAQLIQLKDQTHLLSRQYDRELSNLLALQAEIAQEVADEIQLTLTPAGKKPAAPPAQQLSPAALEAYDLYLEGRYFWNKRTATDLEQAVASFQKSIAKDPTFARSYAGLADSYAIMSAFGFRPTQIMPQAREAALQALRLDESLAEAHTSLALIAENYDYDWDTAEKEYRRAIVLDPNYATAHHWYAECLMWMGRFDEALRESDRARQLDPLSLIIATDRGAILTYARQYDRAIEQLQAVLQMDPNFPRAQIINESYLAVGRSAEAVANLERNRKRWGGPWYHAVLTTYYASSGQTRLARMEFEKAERQYRAHRLTDVDMIGPYIVMGRKDDALRCLESAYAKHSQILLYLKISPMYDPLRSDPRFQALLHRVGLDRQ